MWADVRVDVEHDAVGLTVQLSGLCVSFSGRLWKAPAALTRFTARRGDLTAPGRLSSPTV